MRNSPLLPSVIVVRRFIPILIALCLAWSLVWLMGIFSPPAAATPPARVEVQAPAFAIGVTRYVSTTGSLTGSCLSPVTACRTLQHAVDQAGAGDIIKVAQGLYTGVSNRNGTNQLARIPVSVTIEGGYEGRFLWASDPVNYPVILNPLSQGRALYVTNNAAVTVKNLAITSGRGLSAGDDGDGGGVRVFNAALALNNVTLSSSTARNGGAIAVTGAASAVTMDSSTLIENNSASGSGGALYVSGGSVTVNGSAILQNSAAVDGGAIAVIGGVNPTVRLNSGASFQANQANQGRGGAIYASKGEVYLTGVTILGQVSQSNGGLIYLHESKLEATAGTTFLDNSTSGDGIIYADTNSTLLFNNVTATGNSAASGGLLRANKSQVTVRNSTFTANQASTGDGGALLISEGALVIENTTLSGNSARNGGALHVLSAPATLSGSTLEANEAETKGGALYVSAGTLILNNSNWISNIAQSDGGAIYGQASSLTATGGSFTENRTLDTGSGGAIFWQGQSLSISNSTLSANEAQGRGGALNVLTGTVTLNNSNWLNNTAHSHGGAIYGLGSSLTGAGGGFTENRALKSGSGGAIYWEGMPLTLNSMVTFQGNSAGVEILARARMGGADDPLHGQIVEAFTPRWLSLEELDARGWVNNGRVEVTPEMLSEGSMALGNLMAALQEPMPADVGHLSLETEEASTPGPMARSVAATAVITTQVITRSGGAIYSRNADLLLTSPSFTSNQAQVAGGALYAEGGSLTLTNGAFSNNRARTAPGGGLYLNKVSGGVNGTTFANNRAANGGGAYVLNGAMILDSNIVRDNRADIDGGGFFLIGGNHTVRKSTVEKNTSDRGGGIYLDGGAMTITDTKIQDNVTTYQRTQIRQAQVGIGVGVYVSGTKELSFTHNIVEGNKIPFDQYDRIVKVLTETLIITSVEPIIIKCSTPTDPSCIITERVVIADNGGGMYLTGAEGIIANSIFRENQASRSGGALLMEGGELSLVNNLMVRNTIMVSTGLGSAVFISGTKASFVHNTIADNIHQNVTGEGSNAAIYYSDKGSNLKLYNNIFANHDLGVAGSDGAQAEGEANVWWNHRLRHWSEDLFESPDPIFGDPAFKDAAGGDYRIQRTSSAYNRGVNVGDVVPPGFAGSDLIGERRLQPVDAGAYEENYTAGLNLFQMATNLNMAKGVETTYVITILNNSKSPIQGVTLSNALPAQQEKLSIVSTRGSCNLATLTCNVGALAIGDQAVISVQARATVEAPPGQIVEMQNVATVNFTNFNANDSDKTSQLTTYLQALVLGEVAQARAGTPTHTGACAVKLVTEERGSSYWPSVQDAVNRVLLSTDRILVSGICLGSVNLLLNKNMLIQGGWSTDFSAHDPAAYPTTLRTTSGRVVNVMMEGIEPRLYDLTLTGGNAPRGGGIYVLEASPVFSNVIVSGNRANSDGGGVYVDVGSEPVFQGGIIENNSAGVNGAGVYVKQGGGKFDEVIVRNNSGATDGGGFHLKGSDAEVSNSQILGHVVSGYGGGVYMTGSRAQIRNSLISGNVAGSSGGGIFALKSPATIQFNRIINNRTSAGEMKFVPFIFDLALVEKRGGGGGIYAESSDIRILNNYIAKNRAGATSGHVGSGIHMWLFNSPEVSGNMIVDNVGNGVYMRQNRSIFKFFLLLPPLMPPPFSPEIILPLPTPPAVKLYHNTIVNNSGVGIYAYSQTNIDLLNNLISANGGDGVKIGEEIIPHLIVVIVPGFGFFIPIPIIYPTFYPPQAEVAFTFWGPSPSTSSSGAFSKLSQSDGLSGENPAFLDPGAGIYHIKRISKAFQTAKASSVGQDIDQEDRKQGQKADIGADEYTFRQTRYATVGGTDAASAHLCLDWKQPCTLQTAIDTAEDGDLIKVAGYTDGRTYSTIIPRAGHQSVAIVRKNITIQGGYCETTTAQSGVMECDWEYTHPHKYKTIFDARGAGRGLTIQTDKGMEIFDIHITGGAAELGGALYVISSTAVLSNVNIYGNNATHGGGAYFISSKAVMNQSRIAGNNATHGGGVYLAGDSEITLHNSLIENNNSQAGGGIYANQSKSHLTENEIRGNNAAQTGGGLHLVQSELQMEANLIEANKAPLGGGFYLAAGAPLLTGNRVQLNQATDGGGFYLDGSGGLIEQNQVDQNAATGKGGGFYLTNTEANIKENGVRSNSAQTGAGMHLFGASKVQVIGNRVSGNIAAGDGGGLYLDASSATLEDNIVDANSGVNGGGLYLVNFSAAKLNNNQVLSNTASADGGGFFVRLSNASLIDVTIQANSGRTGGGIYAKLSNIKFEKGHVERNSSSGLGGGIFLDESDTSIQDSAFYTNTSGADGGGLYVLRSGGAKVLTSYFNGNSAAGSGGGVYINDSNIELKGRTFLANSAGINGGGVYADKSDIKLLQFLIRGNQAQNGAGIYLANGSDAELFANAYVDNRASGNGGAILVEGSNPQIYHGTFARNQGNEAVFIDTFGPIISSVAFLNTIMADHAVAIRITEKNSATLEGTLWHNTGQEWTGAGAVATGEEKIYADPLFAADGYHITKYSPAIDAAVPGSNVSEDIDGQVFPMGTADIGADEYPVECVAQRAGAPAITYTSIQQAVDAAQPGELIKVGGVCMESNLRNGVVQVLYLDKTVHIRGGYTSEDWTTSYPITQPTTIEPLTEARGIYIVGNIQPVIESVIIRAGTAGGQGGGPDGQDAGGNLYIIDAAPTFSGTIISGGNGGVYGGAGYLLRSSARFITNTVESNKATAGGAFFLQQSDAVFRDNDLRDNGASKDGGAFFLNNSQAEIRNNRFDENSAGTAGGALFLDGSAATIVGNRLVKNNSKGSAGAIYLDYSPATVSRNLFQENSAESAGALMIAHSDAILDGNQLFKNKALNGGGVYIERSAPSIVNNMVVSNSVTSSGSGIYVLSGQPALLHNTIAYNHGGDGSAISIAAVGGQQSDVTLQNNIIAYHQLGIFVQADSKATANGTLWHQNQTNAGTAPGNPAGFEEGPVRRVADPLFVDAGKLDFRLRSASPAINAGLASPVQEDFEGHPRPTDRAPDVGADEYYAPDLLLIGQVLPNPAVAGEEVTFAGQLSNIGNVILHAVITGTVPAALTPNNIQSWQVTIPPGQTWVDGFKLVVPESFTSDVQYSFTASTREGSQGAVTNTVKVQPPQREVKVQITRTPEQVLLGKPVEYKLAVSNTGNRQLALTIAVTRPVQTNPDGQLTWPVTIPPAGLWQQTLVVTPTTDSPQEMVLAARVTSQDGAISVEQTDRATIGKTGISLKQPLIEPNPVVMGQPFSITVSVQNTGTVAVGADLSLVLDPDFLLAPVKLQKSIAAGETLTELIPVQASGYIGVITATATLKTDSGLYLQEAATATADVALLDPTIRSKQNGPWDDPNTWTPSRVPNAGDVVSVEKAHTVRYVTPIQVESIVVRGTLLGPEKTPISIQARQEIQNYGEILAASGSHSVGEVDGEAGCEIQLKAQTLHNEGDILGGHGGNSEQGRGGDGGAIFIEADLISNMGQIRAGDGGKGGDGGHGGVIAVKIASANGELISEGEILGGNGGNGLAQAGDPGGLDGAGGQGGGVSITGPGGQADDGAGGEPDAGGGNVVVFGVVKAGDGGDGTNAGGDGGGVRMDVGAGSPDGKTPGGAVTNAGEINAGQGGKVTGAGTGNPGGAGAADGCGGNGGDVQLVAREILNEGAIRGGHGGDVTGNGSAQAPGEKGCGGDGGDVTLIGGQGGAGVVANVSPTPPEGGKILAGNGGNANSAAVAPQDGGDGGSVNIMASPAVIIEDGEVRAGEAGKGAGPTGVDGVQGDVTISGGDGNYVDDPVIALVGDETFISAKNLTIMGGDALVLEINSLDEEAIQVKGILILAVGAGGKLDLTDNDSRIFLVDGSFLIYATANAIVLDGGISLADLTNLAPQVLGYRILYAVRLVAPQILLVRPGDQVRIPLLVSNFGPAGDSYRVARSVSVQSSGRSDVEPWSVSEPPSILPVAGSTINRTAFLVTVPDSAKVGSRQTVQISANSYSDGSVEAIGATQLIVQAGGPRVRPIYLPWIMHLFDRAAAQAPAATDHLYLPSISR